MFVLTLAAFVTAAHAQDQEEEEDDGSKYLEESDEDKGRRSRDRRSPDAGEVREIVRGFYGKSNVGGSGYLGSFAQAVQGGTYVSLGIGQDFVDNEKQSMAWEIQLQQGLHNGASFIDQGSAGCGIGAPCTEGDLRTYTVVALYEFSAYPTRRVGVGGHVGGGVLYSPLLMNRSAYEKDVVGQEWDGFEPGLHDSPKPVVLVGPTFEYYTKLSHLSVGAEADVFYGIGWDLGLNGSGYLKYTF